MVTPASTHVAITDAPDDYADAADAVIAAAREDVDKPPPPCVVCSPPCVVCSRRPACDFCDGNLHRTRSFPPTSCRFGRIAAYC